MKSTKTSKLLSIESYTDANIFIGKHPGERLYYVSRCYEASPLVGGGEQLEVFVSSIFKLAPDESILQVNLIVPPDLDTPTIYKHNKNHGGPMVQELVRQRADMAREASTSKGALTNLVLTNQKKLIISFSVPAKAVPKESIAGYTNLHDDFYQSLITAGFNDARSLNPKEVIGLYRQCANINMHYEPATALDPATDLRRQVFTPSDDLDFEHESYALFNNKKCTAIVPKEYAEGLYLGIANMLIGAPFNEGSPKDGGGGLRINLPHIVSATVRLLKQDQEKRRLQRAIRSRRDLYRLPDMLALGEENERVVDDLSYMLDQVTSGGDKYTKASLSYFLFSGPDDEGRLKRDITTIRNILDNFGFDGWQVLNKGVGVRWAQSLPMNYSAKVAEELDNEVDMPSSAASALLPVYGNWRGNANLKSTGSLFWSERGEPFFFDPFKTNSNMNGIIAAQPGAGKGVLVNQMIVDARANGNFVAVIDNGNSYRKLCDTIDGEYISFDIEHNKISLNPFSGLNAETFEEESKGIAELLLKMTNFTAIPSDAERSAMQDAVKAAWGDDDGRNADKKSLTSVEDALNRISKDVSDYSSKFGLSEKEEAARNLAGRLRAFSQDTRRSSFFSGESNLKAKKDFIVIELSGLDSDPHLKEVVLFYVLNKILGWVNRDEGKKLIFLDECWEIFAKENAAGVIESLVRKARKEGGGIWPITQSPLDGKDSPSAQVINKFSNWKILLEQDASAVNELINERFYGKRTDDQYFCRLLTETKTVKGKYSEILIMNPDGYEKVRHYLNPFMLMVFNTEQEEREKVFNLMNTGMSAIEAVETVANDFTVSRRIWLERQVNHLLDHEGYDRNQLIQAVNQIIDERKRA